MRASQRHRRRRAARRARRSCRSPMRRAGAVCSKTWDRFHLPCPSPAASISGASRSRCRPMPTTPSSRIGAGVIEERMIALDRRGRPPRRPRGRSRPARWRATHGARMRRTARGETRDERAHGLSRRSPRRSGRWSMLYLARRLRRGKEDRGRFAERRGMRQPAAARRGRSSGCMRRASARRCRCWR